MMVHNKYASGGIIVIDRLLSPSEQYTFTYIFMSIDHKTGYTLSGLGVLRVFDLFVLEFQSPKKFLWLYLAPPSFVTFNTKNKMVMARIMNLVDITVIYILLYTYVTINLDNRIV